METTHTLQDQIADWAVGNIGHPAECGTSEWQLQVFEQSTFCVEELGEVARAIAKAQSGVRSDTDWNAEIPKELGDLYITLDIFASRIGFRIDAHNYPMLGPVGDVRPSVTGRIYVATQVLEVSRALGEIGYALTMSFTYPGEWDAVSDKLYDTLVALYALSSCLGVDLDVAARDRWENTISKRVNGKRAD
jgi:NTP pyrophosphatase (non-canonical NTP hydrolase)